MLVCAAALVALIAAGAGAAVISSSGPVTGIAVGDDLSCQVSYANDVAFEFYPPNTGLGDCGTFLVVGDTLYAPDFDAHGASATWSLGDYVPFSPVSQTGVLGTGTATDPFRVRTVVEAPGTALQVVEEVSYVAGTQSFHVDTSVENLGGPVDATLYHAGDCYASGSDIGFGFTRPEIRSAGCSQTADNVPAGRTIQMSPLSSGSHFYEAGFSEVWAQIGAHAAFPDTCRCGEHVDNGVGLSWSLSIPSGVRAERALDISFTETAQAAPLADGDGDALPDGWETGSAASGDYANLASLGADPNRKDVFVHADWMAGCPPPAGWERDAIATFAAHGIALHIDSGPTSLNADLQPWGARSRAGALLYQPDLPIWGAQFDALKDAYFIASNRRRAFHYMAFVNRFNSSTLSGQSRGFGDADFIVATCGASKVARLDPKRWTTVSFVHELGHNLGLHHGGGDDVNGKPSYYSIMNYYWGWFGGIRLQRRLVPPGAVNRYLPNLSDSTRPPSDENDVDERVSAVMPVAWVCPGAGSSDGTIHPEDVSYAFGQGADVVDWDCDGIYGEKSRKQDLNHDGVKGLLTSFDDWDNLRFDGGSVIGDFDIPPRPDPPIVAEPTADEVVRTAETLARSVRAMRKQLLVQASKTRVKARRATLLRVRVLANGRGVRGARVRVRGARVLEGRGARTDRRGRVTLRLRPKRHGDVTILAKRRGFERGGIVVLVKRRR